MMMLLQLTFALSTLVSISGSSDVFRWVGDSVQMDIQSPVPDFDNLIWEFNRTNNIFNYNRLTNKARLYPGYEDRVEFNKGTYSLTLKNLQKTDSGLYAARAAGAVDKVVAEYSLSVLVPRSVVISVGKSVQLDIQRPVPEFDELSWVINNTNNVLKYYKDTSKTTQYPGYIDRVEFNEGTYRLTLKNLQKNDSGPYEARASGDIDTVVAVYNLSVSDSVAPSAAAGGVCLLKTGLESIILILLMSLLL